MKHLLLLPALFGALISCKKTPYLPAEEVIKGDWTIHSASYTPPGLFRSAIDVSKKYEGSTIHIGEDQSANYNNTVLRQSRQGSWSMSKEPYSITDDNGITIDYEDIYIYFEWQQAPTQKWLLGHRKTNEISFSEEYNGGYYIFQLKRI